MREKIDRTNYDIDKIRNEYLKKYYTKREKLDNNSLLSLGLNMYSDDNDIKNKLYNIFNKSYYNNNIILHCEQIEVLNLLFSGRNVLVSAPTSFGKTYIAFEYIYRRKMNNVVFVVPTLALMNEISLKIKKNFVEYNIITNSFEILKEKNIFILVPERVDNELLKKIQKIDFLVFDEIYKLKRIEKNNKNDKRIIALNKGYFDMVNKANQILLLGPFIKTLSFERTKLKDNIVEYYTNFSPVYIKTKYVNSQKKQFTIKRINADNSKLVYFKTPINIYKFCNSNKFKKDSYRNSLTDWCDKYISVKWLPSEMLKKGIGIHHGSIPSFMRKYIEMLYNKKILKNVLCTSTLLEGINTPTNELIIYDSDKLTSFQINNLIGRVGRLDTYQIGNVYYFDKKLEDKIIGEDKYEDLIIVAEDSSIIKLEEFIYLEKNPQDLTEEQREKIGKLKKYLSIYGKNLDDLRQTDNFNLDELMKAIEKIPELFELLKEHNNNILSQNPKIKGKNSESRSKIIKLFMDVIPSKTSYVKLINEKNIKKISPSVCVNSLLNLKPTNIYNKINKEIQKQKSRITFESLNIYIDYLFYLSFDYIKHNLIKVVKYYNFIFNEIYVENLIDDEKELIKLLNTDIFKRFDLFNSNDNKVIKILLDIGIPYGDAKILYEKFLKKELDDKNISTGEIYKLLDSKIEDIFKTNNIEQITKDLLLMINEK